MKTIFTWIFALLGQQKTSMATLGYTGAHRPALVDDTPVDPVVDADRQMRLLASAEAMRHGLGSGAVALILAQGRAAYRREHHLGVALAAIRQAAWEMADGWDRVAAATGCPTWPRVVATNAHIRPIPRRRRRRLASLTPPPDGPEVA